MSSETHGLVFPWGVLLRRATLLATTAKFGPLSETFIAEKSPQVRDSSVPSPVHCARFKPNPAKVHLERFTPVKSYLQL